MLNKTMLKRVFKEVLAEVAPDKLIKQQCSLQNNLLSIKGKLYDLNLYKNIYLLGSGKAVIPMANAMNEIMGSKINETVIVGAYPYEEKNNNYKYIQSSHPLPEEKSVKTALCFKSMLQSFGKNDFFIYLLSGGTSAMLEQPEDKITLKELQEVTSLMIKAGMSIEEINSVRKHLSCIKGGKLAAYTKAKGVVLVLSDVINDDLHSIGSAPLYFDASTYDDALRALKKHKIFAKIPQSIKIFLENGSLGHHKETPKKENKNITHHILGSNDIVLQKTQDILRTHGIKTTIIKEKISGDTFDVAKKLMKFSLSNKNKKQCYLFGGEPTVVVKGNGKGGRNQHLCLSFLSLLKPGLRLTFLSAATDGIDGNSTAAGAIIDDKSLEIAREKKIEICDYLENFNSNSYFAKTGELIVTGATNNNLLDIVILCISI